MNERARLSTSTSTPTPPPWNRSQRAVLIGLSAALVIYLSIRLWLNPQYVSDPQPSHPPHELDLQDRIDPNTADVATLAALPMIGEKRARDIVTYREQFVTQHAPGEAAYKRAEDLLRIRGIGNAMLQTLRPYLIFPQNRASTTQSNTSRAID
jgi:DNA uptake protein ComE-like DNA-binding protein